MENNKMSHIFKIKLFNFKRFKNFAIGFDEKLNLLIGDNEAGKSTILTAIDLVLSGSRNKVEAIGLENLFNAELITEFLAGERKYENIPRLTIELYLSEQDNPDTNGKNNTDNHTCDGLKMVCEPNDSLSTHINEILQSENPNFPFEFYSINFYTFANEAYTGYKRFMKHIMVDNSQVSSEYALKEYVKDIYYANLSNPVERYAHQHKYRVAKDGFRNSAFTDLNTRLGGDINFSIRNNSKSNLESDLAILEGNINIENKGKGKLCFVKTELALKRADNDLQVVLIEEPENHLSHLNMKRLITNISQADNKQIFIATHSDMISTRLDLRKSILLNSSNTTPLKLNDLPDETAKFFIKAPDKNILEFILSKKVILVEGDAEYILMDAFYRKATDRDIDNDGIHIISVDGKTFKRYMDIALLLGIKTAVLTDNDGDFASNITNNYKDYVHDSIGIFSDTNDARYTFEVCMYQDNSTACEALFSVGRRKFTDPAKIVTPQQYMLKHKTDAALAR